MFALSKGRDLNAAVRIANVAGAAAVKSLGADLDDESLEWFRRKIGAIA